jgi:hypothetical protein
MQNSVLGCYLFCPNGALGAARFVAELVVTSLIFMVNVAWATVMLG